LYTIKQASTRSGVPVQLLRAWERRYGIVQPARTDSGYRLYDDAAIARLRAMRALIGEGWTASTAADHLRDLDDAAVDRLLELAGAAEPLTAGANATDAAAERLRGSFVEAAAALDEPAVEQVLDDMFARGSFERVTSELLMPALVDLGEGWADGRVDIAGEHAATASVHRRLASSFMAAGAPADGDGLVLVGMPPGGRHELGALAFATIARRAGLSVRYLGADLPADDWVDAVLRTRARAVVIGVVIRADINAAGTVARAVRVAAPEALIAFGGRRATAVPTAGLEPALVLPDLLPESIVALRVAIDEAA
jgi:DNA-binding transcriptional MerR regulator